MVCDYIFKVLVIGDRGVGKTTLINQLADNRQADIGDSRIRTEVIEGKTLKLEILDPVGHERFQEITRQFYRGANGAIIVYDIANQASFDAVDVWVQQLNIHVVGNIPKILVGNKKNIQGGRRVQFAAGQALAEMLGMHFYETDVLPNLNLEGALMHIATQMKEANDPVNEADRIARDRVRLNPHVDQNADQGIWGWGCSC